MHQSGQVSFVASQQRVPGHAKLPTLVKRGIEAALEGPLGVADEQLRKASLQSLGRMRPLQTRCHLVGVGDTRCRDNELRQWMPCVTFSAVPMKVTHARAGALAQVLLELAGAPWIAAGDCGCLSALAHARRGRASAPLAKSQDHSLVGCAATSGPEAAGVSAEQTGYDDDPRRQGKSIFNVSSVELALKTPV